MAQVFSNFAKCHWILFAFCLAKAWGEMSQQVKIAKRSSEDLFKVKLENSDLHKSAVSPLSVEH